VHCGGAVEERLRVVEGRGVGEVLRSYPVFVNTSLCETSNIGSSTGSSGGGRRGGSGGGSSSSGGSIGGSSGGSSNGSSGGSHNRGSGSSIGGSSGDGSSCGNGGSCRGGKSSAMTEVVGVDGGCDIPQVGGTGCVLLSEVLGGPEGLEVLERALAWRWEERFGMEDLLTLPWFKQQRQQLLERYQSSGVLDRAGGGQQGQGTRAQAPLELLVRKWRAMDGTFNTL
jgi:hypothetical protein